MSTLDDLVLPYQGRLLTFDTQYGHGWIGIPPEAPVPSPFSARLIRFFDWRGNRRGGIARVAQAGHECDGLWVVFATRHLGVFDFTDRLAHYNIALLENEPSDPMDNGAFWVIDEKLPEFRTLRMAGFAVISAAPA